MAPIGKINQALVYSGLIGGFMSILTVAGTIAVAHHRIGLNEEALVNTASSTWAKEHVKNPHKGAVSEEELITAQTHIDYKIGIVEKDVQRVEKIVDRMDQKVDQILNEVRVRNP